jgi:hypothetical protein
LVWEGRRTLEPVVVNKIEAPKARPAAECTIGGGIQGDFILVVGKFQKGDTVPIRDIRAPPEDIQMKIVVQRNHRFLAETPSECLKNLRDL